MANKRGEPVSYRPFAAKGAMAQGLLPVAREGLNGDIERRLAQGWFRLAGLAGQYADHAVARAYEKQGVADALQQVPGQVVVEGGGTLLPLPTDTVRPFKTGAVTDGKAFKTNDPVAQGLAPHQKALLNAIAGGESGGKYNIRYTSQGGALFDDLSKHPRMMEPTKAGKKSSAAGRYQFTATTWDALGGGDFSPENQDRRALQLASEVYKKSTGRNLDEDLKTSGLTPQIVNALGGTWEALKHGADRHIATYNESLARYGGGTGDKTAGQLSVSAPAIQPIEMKIDNRGGGFKPLKGNSVGARAYNAAGMRTYLQQLTVAVQTDVMNVYDKLGSDPAEFDKGLAALKTLHLQEHGVPDEIRADYEATFAKAALPFQRQARLEQKKRIETQNKADFNERINVLETEFERRLAVLSMDNEDAVNALWAVQNAREDHYDAAVNHGLMTSEQAANYKIVSRRQAAVAFYEKQAEGKSAAEIKAMVQEMKADFAAGRLDHLDGDGWRQLEANLKAQERGQQVESNKQKGEYVERGKNLIARIELGYELEADALAQFALDQNDVAEGEKIYTQTMKQLNIARQIRDKTMGEAVDFVREMIADMGDTPTDAQIGLRGYAEKALAVKQEMLAKDPLSYGEALRLIAPLDPVLADMTPEGIKAATLERLAAGKQVSTHFGIAPRFFKSGEVAEIGTYVSKNPEHGAMIAGAIVEAAGGDGALMLAEFGDKAPQILQAGSILAMGGEPQAAVDVIYGSADKDEDGRGYKIVGPEKRLAWDAEILGSAVDLLPEDRERITGGAYAITKRRIYLSGVDEKDDEAVGEIYRQALNQAAGQVKINGKTYGGLTTIRDGLWGGGFAVKVMPQIRADRLGALLYAVKLSDFDGADIKPVQLDGKMPLKTSNFGRLYPVEVEGGYLLSENNPNSGVPLWIMGSDGKPFVYNPLDYKEKLAVRVPGAFRP